MPVSRRRLLQFIGLTPALPIIAKIPAMPEMPVMPETVPIVNQAIMISGAPFVSGGMCAPFSPLYDLPGMESRPVRDSLPAITARRGGIRYR